MGKLLFVVLLAGAGWWVYKQHFADSDAVATYKEFAEAWANNRSREATDIVSSSVLADALGPESFPKVLAEPLGSVRGVSFEIESETPTPNGRGVAVRAVQSIQFDPPGVTSVFGGAATATVSEVADLERTADGWRVVAFSPSLGGVVDN
jgi:hypothetical protein